MHKQHRLHTHFLTPLYYILSIYIFYNKYCVLCADRSTNGVIMRFVGCTEAAQNLHKLHRTPVLCTTPPSPIPPFSPKVASKRATNPLPSHGLTAEYFSSLKPKETAHPILPTTSKWQIHLHQWQNPHRGGCGLPQGERSVPLRGSTQRGLPSGRFFGDFLIGEKVTQGSGLEAPP